MKKRIVKIITTAVMACILIGTFTMFTACKQYSYEINWNVDLSKKIDINILFPESGMSGFGSDHTADLIQRSTGYKTNYSQIDESNADNEINNAILTSHEPYHAIKLTQAQYDPYVESGAWLDLTELLEKTESGKILYDIIDLMPGAWDSVTYTNADGKKGIYAIPETGFVNMDYNALIWNTSHLEAIGWYDNHDAPPEDLGDVTQCMLDLQNHFGGGNSNYHAFGLGGKNDALVEQFLACYDGNISFFLDENDKIQQYVFSDATEKYVNYMNTLKKAAVLSDSWQSSSSANACSLFATEKCSVVWLPYFWVTPLCNTIVKNGLAKNYQTAHDETIVWNTRVRGDGTYGSVVQEKARKIADNGGNAYYISIPFYMAEDAVYIIDYMAKKLQSFALWYGGEEGVDWNEVTAPTDSKENWSERILYMNEWSYELDGKTFTGGGKWVKLTDSYINFIVDNSMYATGQNVVEARSLFHFREVGFDAWQISIEEDETLLHNPMLFHPTLKYWSPVSILARTKAKNGVASAINAADATASLKITRQSLKETSAKKNGVKYYYWSEDISNEMTDWYFNVKLAK